jgi:hypothetical protein
VRYLRTIPILTKHSRSQPLQLQLLNQPDTEGLCLFLSCPTTQLSSVASPRRPHAFVILPTTITASRTGPCP